jgi:hypothetical protein
MAIVLPFIEKEMPRVLMLLGWMAQLSGRVNRTLYLLPFKGLEIDEITRDARKAFSDVQLIKDSEGVISDWQADAKVRDAAGPNSLFRQAVWFFYTRRDLGPWFWFEPDCVPLVEGWDEELEAAYRSAGKPFFGVPLKWQNGEQYLNGAAIYPQNAVTVAPSLAQLTMWTQNPDMQVGFDVAGGKEVASKAHFTDLIQLEYRCDNPGPTRPGAVLFHGDRAGKLLATMTGGAASAGEQREVPPVIVSRQKPASAQKSEKKLRPPAPAMNPEYHVASYEADPQTGIIRPREITIGDEIRYHVGALIRIASNANRTTRARRLLLRELRKAKLLRK